MAFSRKELTEIIKPHVLRAVVRLHGQYGEQVTEEQVAGMKLSEEERLALLQTKRLVEESPGVYRIRLTV